MRFIPQATEVRTTTSMRRRNRMASMFGTDQERNWMASSASCRSCIVATQGCSPTSASHNGHWLTRQVCSQLNIVGEDIEQRKVHNITSLNNRAIPCDIWLKKLVHWTYYIVHLVLDVLACNHAGWQSKRPKGVFNSYRLAARHAACAHTTHYVVHWGRSERVHNQSKHLKRKDCERMTQGVPRTIFSELSWTVFQPKLLLDDQLFGIENKIISLHLTSILVVSQAWMQLAIHQHLGFMSVSVSGIHPISSQTHCYSSSVLSSYYSILNTSVNSFISLIMWHAIRHWNHH